LFGIVAVSVLLAAAQAPNSGAAWLEQARVAYQKGQFAEARVAAQKALEGNSRAVDAELILGLLDVRQSKFSNAREHLARVIELSPGNASAHYNLGVIELLEKRPALALPHFTAVRRSSAADVPALLGILESHIALNDAPRVAETAHDLASLVANDPAMLNRVAGMLVGRGHYAPAIPVLERLRAEDPRSFERAYNLSLANFRTGQLKSAAGALEPWVGANPNAQALNLLGAIHEKAGRYPDAVRAFERATRLAPSNEDFRIDHASILVETGKLVEASAAFADAVRDFPKSLRARLGLGSAYYLAGKYDPAARSLLETVRLAPDSTAAYALLAKTFDAVPALQEEIRAAFEVYLKKQPRDADAYARYSEMLYVAGNRDEAKRQVMRALEINPQQGEAHLQLGDILQRDEDLTAAVKSLERAVALAPEYAAAHYRLGTAYQKLGRVVESRRELERFRQLKEQEANRDRELLMRAVAAAK
jgi:tetratricopeptide (TPR) repeat protein